jgi:4-pyridoxate dehydrogenase
LRSADPRELPRVHFKFLSAPNDLPTLREGFRRGREIALQKPMDEFRGDEISPGVDVKSDEDIETFIRHTMVTMHHPACTCSMGSGPEAVVDPELRVHGIERLRVVDASAMPDLVTAHINACVTMLAERGANFIRGKVAANQVDSSLPAARRVASEANLAGAMRAGLSSPKGAADSHVA